MSSPLPPPLDGLTLELHIPVGSKTGRNGTIVFKGISDLAQIAAVFTYAAENFPEPHDEQLPGRPAPAPEPKPQPPISDDLHQAFPKPSPPAGGGSRQPSGEKSRIIAAMRMIEKNQCRRQTLQNVDSFV